MGGDNLKSLPRWKNYEVILRDYKVYVYNGQGEIIYKSFLGDAVSLGQQFDFSEAPEGEYTFKLVTKNGKTYSYSVETGA